MAYSHHVLLIIRQSWFRSLPDQQHSFAENNHEIFSTVIVSLPLSQEGQLSVSWEGMCSSTG